MSVSFYARNAASKFRPARRRAMPRGRRLLRVEALEGRALLSAVGFAVPSHLAHTDGHGAEPLGSSGPSGYTPAQVRQAYGFDKITFNNGAIPGDGSGTTIAIVDAYDDPNIANDLHQFNLAFGLPDSGFTKVNQSGGTTYPAPNATWVTEIALDVQWAHAIAPKANILLVEATDNSWNNLFAAIDYARSVPGVVAVSMSFGTPDFSGESYYDSHFTTPAGHSGVTFLAASGDHGSPVLFPAISSNVVGVGGTTLTADSAGNYVSESGWSGSGGGISAYTPQPTYQKGVVTQSTNYRTSPDVAYDSNPGTGFPVYDSYNNGSAAPWGLWGGTSAAAPQWAGLVAIADQGRALAGKAPLDGRTQTLPQLYSMSSSDFHDVTSGTSTGSPSYSATVGYDLVTGRGTPYANLVVSDLVGQVSAPAATHFSLTLPTGSTAGAAFSITVTALDASNNVVPSYQGTVHFASSDSAAVLPPNYTFTGSDNGVHVFSGVTLKTAGPQNLTVTDTTTSSLVGSGTVSVSPAAANHLVFGQQPTNVNPGAVISPAVTVRMLDVYNNLLANDNADQVTLAIGSNPGAGTLSGTTTVTVSGGIATFTNLSIDQAGVGYTLTAGSVAANPVTSVGFTVAVNDVVEAFDSGNLNAYRTVGGASPSASVSSAAAHDGTYGLAEQSGSDWIYRNDAAVQVQQGDTISVWVKFTKSGEGRAYFGFGASSSGTLSLVAAANTSQLLLQNSAGYGATTIGLSSQTWAANHWYRLQVEWGISGTISGSVYDSNGTTLLQRVGGSNTTITAGGIAFKADGKFAKYFDTVQVTPAVNQFTAKAAVAPEGTAPLATTDVHAVGRRIDLAAEVAALLPTTSHPRNDESLELTASDPRLEAWVGDGLLDALARNALAA